MRVLNETKRAGIKRIMAVDPSSHSLAFAILERDKLIASGKVSFPPKSDVDTKLKLIIGSIPLIVARHKPDHFLIEQTIYIQNFGTSRLLSYIVGATRGQVLAQNVSTGDVGPIQWKRELGVEFVKRGDIAKWTLEMGKRDAKKRADFERKERVRLKVLEKIPDLTEEDNDIVDAIAIGLWGLENLK